MGLVFEENNDKKLVPAAGGLREGAKMDCCDGASLSRWGPVSELLIRSDFSFAGDKSMPTVIGADSPRNQSASLECLASLFDRPSLPLAEFGRRSLLSLLEKFGGGAWGGESVVSSGEVENGNLERLIMSD